MSLCNSGRGTLLSPRNLDLGTTLPINENGDVPICIHVGKNIGTGNPVIVFIAIVKALLFQEISTMTFNFDWFT